MTTATATPIKTEKAKTLPESFINKFRNAFLGDDVEGLIQIVAEDAVWTFMATGEKFVGVDQIRKLANTAIAGRIHTKDIHMEFNNVFSTEEWLCIEYLHRAIMPENSTITGAPKAGTEIALPI